MFEYEDEFEEYCENDGLLLLVYLSYQEAKDQGVDFFNYAVDDAVLSEYLDKETTTGNLKHLEIFKRDRNVIATEKGYYMTCYEESVSMDITFD